MQDLRGVHLIIDGYYACDNLDAHFICKLFDDLVSLLDMTYLTKPVGVEVPLDKEKLNTEFDEGGWSYYCQITTSHIALHLWPLKKALMMDIFSCLPFNAAKALTLIDERLDLISFQSQTVHRNLPRPN